MMPATGYVAPALLWLHCTLPSLPFPITPLLEFLECKKGGFPRILEQTLL